MRRRASDLGRPGSRLSASKPTVVPIAPLVERRQRRMHRMPEPHSVQRVGDHIARAAQRVEGNADQVLEPVARPIQPSLASDDDTSTRPPACRNRPSMDASTMAPVLPLNCRPPTKLPTGQFSDMP